MRTILPKELFTLAKSCPKPLYVVGGSVRDFLANFSPAVRDVDICAPIPAEEFAAIATEVGFRVLAAYKATETVKLRGEEGEYEYAAFRSDSYVRGEHTPSAIYFTEDIRLDAKRRDFTANAVYFDLQTESYVDPLGGIAAIREKRLTTVDTPEKVFGEDGLRLMRLARQAAQLGFTPDEGCLRGATKNAALVQDVHIERVFQELLALLTAEQKCGVADAPYRGLRILSQTGVLDYILPELTQGRNLAQRADFHQYDVLEHSFRAVKYMEKLSLSPLLRLAALLHDVGKPLCMLRDGNAYAHSEEGANLTERILTRLKAPKKTIRTVSWLVKWHMYDYDCRANEKKLRRFLVKNQSELPLLLLLKQADFSACMDEQGKAPTCARWEALYAQMKAEGVPFSLKELAVDGKILLDEGFPPHRLSQILDGLLMHLAVFPKDNRKSTLLALAKGLEKSLLQE